MKVLLWVATLLLLSGCSVERSLEATVTGNNGQNGIDGAAGMNGTDGVNGHSIVSLYKNASEIECSNSGQRLDMYIDLDNSLSVTDADQYTNSIVICNGLNGQQGAPGTVGEPGPTGSIGPQGIAGQDGVDGQQGPTGPQGSQGIQGLPGASSGSGATIVDYGSSSCTRISGTNSYVKPTGSNNFGLYTSSSCSSNSKFAEVSQGESYWVSSTSLSTYADGRLRVITFN